MKTLFYWFRRVVLKINAKASYCFLVMLMMCVVLPSNVLADPMIRLANFYSDKQSLSEKVLEQVYKRLHIEMSIVYFPAARTLWLANNGTVDGEVARLAGLEKTYPNLLMVKTPITVISPSVYTKKETYFTVQGWQSLKPYRVAYLRGVKFIERNLNGLSIEGEGVATTEQAFIMLEHNRVDVVISDANQTANLLPKYPDIKMLSPAVDSFPAYHYLNKKHADLVPKVEAVLQQMIDDKTIERLTSEINN
jgi:polar amino acid transport system substrate-binding protein